ncbi:MAG: hypothetical protein Q7T34_01540 [Candidatus Parcubacteria bacterium]|nr:hypothetical protein [Candidatus Parcubacteria bacterium]
MKKILQSILPLIIAFVLAGYSSVGIAQTTDEDVQNTLNQMRQSRQEFKNAKAQEASEAAGVGKAKGEAQRLVAQEKRETAQQRMEEKRKEVLLKLFDIQIKHLERTKARVQKMPNITDELKAQLATEIDIVIQKLNDEKVKVQAATGQEEIKNLAKEIRDFFKSYKDIVKNIVDAIHNSRANNAAATAEERLAAVKAKVQELKAQGKDTSDIDTEIEEAETDIDDAQEAIGRKAFKEGNEDLKGAYQKFRNIAQEAKGL